MHIVAPPAWTPTQNDSTPPFSGRSFERFDTPITQLMGKIALFVTLTSAVLLMVFFVVQPQLATPLRIGYCVGMIVLLAVIGHTMTRTKSTETKP